MTVADLAASLDVREVAAPLTGPATPCCATAPPNGATTIDADAAVAGALPGLASGPLCIPRVAGGWATLILDPPWSFNDKGSRAAPDWTDATAGYQTMSEDDILALPIDEIAAANSHLYLWTTDSHLPLALRCIERWGFKFKQVLVWRKMTTNGKVHFGMGHYYRHSQELVLFAVRGKAPARVRNLRSIFDALAGKHSVKPDELQHLAEQMSPAPRVELFARRHLTGWTCWGNQLAAGSVSAAPAADVTLPASTDNSDAATSPVAMISEATSPVDAAADITAEGTVSAVTPSSSGASPASPVDPAEDIIAEGEVTLAGPDRQTQTTEVAPSTSEVSSAAVADEPHVQTATPLPASATSASTKPLSKREAAVLAALAGSEMSEKTIEEMAVEVFGPEPKGNSWVRNQLRGLRTRQLVEIVRPGTYRATAAAFEEPPGGNASAPASSITP